MIGSVNAMAMNTFVCLAILLVIHSWIIRVNGGDCNTVFRNTPTFKICQYRCHCKNDTQCNQTTGACDNDCEFGWMGPGCQYRNIARNYSGIGNIGWTDIESERATKAVDGNVTSCSRSKAPTMYHYWRIQWNIEYRIVGLVLKIHTEDVGDFTQFRVETGSGPNNEDFNSVCYTHGDTPGTTEMEIMCTQPVWTKHLRIIHNAPNVRMRVCEVEIYGGRVVTFNKPTNQTSTNLNRHSWFTVDGQADASGIGANDTCSLTNKEKKPYWLVDFQTTYVVQSLYFYGGRPPLHPEYRYFKIFLLNDSSAVRTEIYSDIGLSALEYQPMVIEQANQITARYLKIFRPVPFDVLAVCEVIAFAECPINKCGWDCTTDCYCAAETTGKYQMDGVCPHGCSGRWTGRDQKCNIECNTTTWGHQCQNTCGNCDETEPCNAVTGHCEHGCNGHWYPPDCEKECNDTAYGKNCSQTCGHCKNNERCNMAVGNCTNGCMPGWQPPLCQKECSAGKYGENCIEHCGQCSGSSTCNVSTGVCEDGCSPGYLTSFCKTTCELGSYGMNCSEKCGHCKTGTTCNATNGECHHGCEPGWTANNCKNACKNGTYGENCSSVCGKCFGGKTCNHITGLCTNGCAAGFNGQRCNQVCPAGKYGENCVEHCGQCSGSSTCNVSTGVCEDGCSPGYLTSFCKTNCGLGSYGANCSEKCGHCKTGTTCNATNGECHHGCEPGWTSNICKNACKNGTYGENCSSVCGKCFGGKTCNHTTGLCENGCAAGFNGQRCNQECIVGTFGVNCSQRCGHCNTPEECSRETGLCSNKCLPGWNGSYCNLTCHAGTYGESCTGVCGNCAGGEAYCNHITGQCAKGCAAGYIGERCKETCQFGSYGVNCTEICGHCKSGTTCKATNGECFHGCEPGWIAFACKNACENGTYGEHCNTVCGNCDQGKTCNRMTGLCTNGCAAGFKGERCDQECSPGTFGKGCSLKCGYCSSVSECNTETGFCSDSCLPGWTGSYCTEWCPPGLFGLNCSQSCGHCKNLTECEKETGLCSADCFPGWIGSYCNESNALTINLKDNITVTMSSISNGLLPEYAISSFNGPRDPTNCKCCSGTMNAHLSWWRLDLRHTYALKELHVHGVENERVNQLSGFSVYLRNDTNNEETLVFVDTAPVSDDKRQYIIPLYNRTARYVTVRRIGTLTLCNVILIEGECATGFYGDHCEQVCHCVDHRPCDRETGRCQLPVCKIGWTGASCNTECPFQTFGERCSKQCFCKHGTCTKDYGICNGECQTGFEGVHCNEDSIGNSSGNISAIVGGCFGAVLLIVLVLLFSLYRFRIYKRDQRIRENIELPDTCTVISNENTYDTIDDDIATKETIL